MKIQILLFLFIAFGFLSNTKAKNHQNDSIHILLIGNSFTYYNDMPGKLNQLFFENEKNIKVTQVSFSGYYLMAHLTKNQHYKKGDLTETIDIIQSQKWDIIVLQESSFFLLNEIKQRQTTEAIQAIQTLNNNENTQFYFFQTWTSKLNYPYEVCYPAKSLFIKSSNPMEEICSYIFQNEEEFHQTLIKKTEFTALEAKIEIIRFGEIFHEISKEFPELELLEDDMHPSDLGAFINALTMFYKITNTEIKQQDYFVSFPQNRTV